LRIVMAKSAPGMSTTATANVTNVRYEARVTLGSLG
jgi:hypothetical protein